ncbi:hypothetical protein CVT26_008476 [Gymnopilus dilepis]|uniref:Ubiquitin carboxyl-terminal hydrolase n=1 Tax=Gymnopilus dilepis TaxID=231916 RepID=A0A409XXH1_9AGAR|nr:hypothetical protein CVT26_008476 [Gymnopilus dilepis]
MPSSSSSSCPHVAVALGGAGDGELSVRDANSVAGKYTSVVTWAAYRSMSASASGSGLNGRPTKRRKCSFIGCWHEGHMRQHLKTSGHQFCVDSRSGSVYCTECEDFIYNHKLEKLQLRATVAAEEKLSKAQSSKSIREPYKPWTPNAKELEALQGAEPIPCHGRRGLLNLGQTCYMNVVLQCFIHNPLLRNYFLSDKHNSKQCKTENCTSCEMDKLYAEIYSDSSTPYAPTTFLSTSWKASPPELSGYAQQDAHEFFMACVNHIHSTSRGCTNVSCNCIIHSTFAGSLQSDVCCGLCGSVRSTVDPVLDVSLELRGGGGGEGDTLGNCLRRFTQPEKLGKEYSCAKCAKASPEATKRFSIRKLPPVLAFQFKRFEHKTNDKSSARKIDTPVRFPAVLNMAPYTTQAIKANASNGPNGVNGHHGHGYPGRDAMCEYDLFAVINHEGGIDNGHYTNFARCKDEWFRFDDDKVTPSTLGACLASNAYMCFYVKRYLDYKPNTVPSYVRSREQEMMREKEVEKERAEHERTGTAERDAKELRLEREREREAKLEREREAREARERERERERKEREQASRLTDLDEELLSLS